MITQSHRCRHDIIRHVTQKLKTNELSRCNPSVERNAIFLGDNFIQRQVTLDSIDTTSRDPGIFRRLQCHKAQTTRGDEISTSGSSHLLVIADTVVRRSLTCCVCGAIAPAAAAVTGAPPTIISYRATRQQPAHTQSKRCRL